MFTMSGFGWLTVKLLTVKQPLASFTTTLYRPAHNALGLAEPQSILYGGVPPEISLITVPSQSL